MPCNNLRQTLKGDLKMGKLLIAVAMMVSFSSTASARFLDQMTDTSSNIPVKVDPNDVSSYSKLVVKCFAQNTAKVQDCKNLKKSGSKMTSDQYAAIRSNLVKYINASQDMNKKHIVQMALAKFDKMASHYKRSATNSKVAKN